MNKKFSVPTWERPGFNKQKLDMWRQIMALHKQIKRSSEKDKKTLTERLEVLIGIYNDLK